MTVNCALAQPVYKDATKPIEERVEDLLGKMTVEEKVAQLQTIWHLRRKLEDKQGNFIPEKAASIMGEGIGQIARPSENKSPLETVRFTNASQRWLIENTRLGIPAIFHEEALHGHAASDATSFPQAIGLASTWDPALLREVYTVAAQEIRKRGGTQALTPILDVARDPRWGRTEETMGEDPYLVAAMGVEGIKGFQGENFPIQNDRVIATLKHLAGHGEPTGGLNIAPTPVGERTLREVFLFPFEAAVKLANARSVMASYNEIDGIPSHANGDMLNGILRDEWGFNGILVSDYFAIAELQTRHRLSDSLEGAAAIALNAGVDIEMPDSDAYPHLITLVKNKKLDIELINTATRRVLREKFLLGLFEHPYADEEGVTDFVGNAHHQTLALEAAEKSMVLLKNDAVNGKPLLPVDAKKLKRVALIGPHGDEVLLGGYSDIPKKSVSILEGLKTYLGKDVKVVHEKGTLLTLDTFELSPNAKESNSFSKDRWNADEIVVATKKDKKGLLKKAVKAARKSDLAIVVVGDNEMTSREAWAEAHLGDRASLQLFGEQQALVEAVLETGTPTILLLLNGRPLAISKLAQQAPAIIEGWYLGQETGHAVSKVIFGDVNPSGKLPISIPRSVGHIPVYYNHKPTAKRGYAFSETSALFPFGHGLSYTDFEYSDIKIDRETLAENESIKITATIKNTGNRDGEEVVQLYINDPIASITRPVKELKGFKRVSLKPKQSATIEFTLFANQLGFYDKNINHILEPGLIKVFVGSSSDDIRLEHQFTITGKTSDISDKKAYLSLTEVHYF